MSLPVPNLDDKRWAELVEEAVARIPLLTSRWTDFNVHDPGITFIELFAWLAEFQRYRLAQLSDQTLRSFLKLVDLAPRPLNPARVEVSFDTSLLPQGLLWPKGTLLLPIGNEEIVFQLAADTFLTANFLRRVTTQFDDRRLDQTKANQAIDIAFFPFQADAPLGAILELEFEGRFQVPEFELTVWLSEEDLPPVGGHGGEAPGVTPSASLVWEYSDGSAWSGIAVLSDGTNNLHSSGRIRFQTPAASSNSGAFRLRCRLQGGRYEIPPSIRRLSLNTAEALQIQTIVNESLGEGNGKPDQAVSLQHAPVLDDGAAPPTLQAGDILDWEAFLLRLADPDRTASVGRLWKKLDQDTQNDLTGLNEGGLARLRSPAGRSRRESLLYSLIRTINQQLSNPEFLEGSQPSPDTLSRCSSQQASKAQAAKRNRTLISSILPDLVPSGPLVLQVGTPKPDGTVAWQEWQQVEGFGESGPGHTHFALDLMSGQVRFGNGLNGQAPQRGQLIRARYYRHSRGEAGNLPPGQLWEIRQEGIRLTGRNLQAASGGRGSEPLEEARLRAQQRFHERIRGLTAGDFEELARQTPGLRVARAKALANHHPDFPGLEAPGVVTVVVVPYRRAEDKRPPSPGEGFLHNVGRHLESHRLVATQIRAVAPRYRPFSFSARLFLRRRSAESEVRRRLRANLEDFFDPLTGGPDEKSKKGWPLGRSLFPSEIYSLLDSDPAVDYAAALRINDQPVDQPLPLESDELPHFSWEGTQLEFIPFEARPAAGDEQQERPVQEVQP